MTVLAVDVGGTNVKVLATGQTVPRGFPSGLKMTARLMVQKIEELQDAQVEPHVWKIERLDRGRYQRAERSILKRSHLCNSG
jgi:hypothetical protein